MRSATQLLHVRSNDMVASSRSFVGGMLVERRSFLLSMLCQLDCELVATDAKKGIVLLNSLLRLLEISQCLGYKN
jgi:hypothetical protein